MKKSFQHVYQFRISLKGIRPPIWRRLQVPATYSFWDLHVAIQDAMGWIDSHLHSFSMLNPRSGFIEDIGIPDGEWAFEYESLAGWEESIKEWFSPANARATYIYDFGDNWVHTVKLEKIIEKEKGIGYPRCIAGRRACPPEDCGGVHGYGVFLDVIMDPANEEHEEMLEWVGGGFDPEHFDVREIEFDDPDLRLKFALSTREIEC